MGLINRTHVQKITWTDAGKTSDAFKVSETVWAAVQYPSTFQGTSVTFLAATSRTATTFATLYGTTGAAVSATVAASRVVPLPNDALSAHSLKMVSGTAEAAGETAWLMSKD